MMIETTSWPGVRLRKKSFSGIAEDTKQERQNLEAFKFISHVKLLKNMHDFTNTIDPFTSFGALKKLIILKKLI